MSEEQKMIIDATMNMPKSQLKEILSYIRYIQFKSIGIDAPEDLIPQDEEELKKLLLEADEEIEREEVESFEEVVAELNDEFSK